MKKFKSVIAVLALLCAFSAPVLADGNTELPGKCPAGQTCGRIAAPPTIFESVLMQVILVITR